MSVTTPPALRQWLAVGLKAFALSSLPIGVLAVYPAPNSACSSTNSTTWEIKGFQIDTNSKFYYGKGTVGRASFDIRNSANGYQFSCTQGSGRDVDSPNFSVRNGEVWYSCNAYCYGPETNPPLDTAFSFDIDTKTLSLSQKWSCGGNSNTTPGKTLLGTGTTTVPALNCKRVPNGRDDQVACAPVDLTVSASVVQEVAGPAHSVPEEVELEVRGGRTGSQFQYTAAPPSVTPSTAGCTERSKTASWTLGPIRYSLQGITFGLTNTALNYTTECNLQDTTTNIRNETPVWRNCTRYSNVRATYPYDGIYTEVLYGGRGDVLGVNQTWYCDDAQQNQATLFSLTGQTAVRYNCNRTRSCYPASLSGTPPEVETREYCSHPGLTLAPGSRVTTSLPVDQARIFFGPHGYNCTGRSLGSPGAQVWEIQDFTFNRTWSPEFQTPGYHDEVTFVYNNTAVNLGPRLCFDVGVESGPLFDGTKELRCQSGLRDLMRFAFDYSKKTLTLAQSWGCDATNRRHANYFNAVEKVILPLQCTAAHGNGTTCTVAGKITVPMSNITATLNSEPVTWDEGF